MNRQDGTGSTESASPTAVAARELLVERGPLSAAALKEALRERHIVADAALIAKLPSRYPSLLEIDSSGLIRAFRQRQPKAVANDTTIHPVAFVFRPQRRLHISIDTTSLDPDASITAVAISDATSSLELDVQLDHSSEHYQQRLADMFDNLERLGTDAVFVGHTLDRFVFPLLRAHAKAVGRAWTTPALAVDLADVSVLAWPGLGERHLRSLCTLASVPLPEQPSAIERAVAMAQVVNYIEADASAHSPEWAPALAALKRGNHPIALLFPPVSSDTRLAFTLAEDPLIGNRSAPARREVPSFVRNGFAKLARRPGFRSRPPQEQMAQAVSEAFLTNARLAVEAPTGTGKTRAYLLPAIGYAATKDTPVVIATATKALQEQLRREAEELRELGLLDVPFRQLMGVDNYVCTREVATLLNDDAQSRDEWLAAAVGARAISVSPSGVWDEVNDTHLVSHSRLYASARRLARTTSDGCERASCEFVATCPMMAHYEGIEDLPGVVTTNHALVGAWHTGGTQSGPGKLLEPGRSALIFDEAHQLEDTFTGIWTEAIDELDFRIIDAIIRGKRGPLVTIQKLVSTLSSATGTTLAASLQLLDTQRAELLDYAEQLTDAAKAYIHEFGGKQQSTTFAVGLQTRSAHSQPELRLLDAALFDCRVASDRLRLCVFDLRQQAEEHLPTAHPGLRRRLDDLERRLLKMGDILRALKDRPDPHAWVYRLGIPAGDVAEDAPWKFERIPVDISVRFAEEVVAPKRSVILTSATLTVNQSFEFIASRLGLEIETADPTSPQTPSTTLRPLRLPSPFDYRTQSRVVLTNHLPVPHPVNQREFVEETAADLTGFLSLTGGKTLGLFAAKTRMREVAAKVREKEEALRERGVELIVQGELARGETSRRFRTNPGTVLFGTKSYWEGFDAPGETLSYLVLEKPPFPSPTDPLIAARQAAVLARGGDPFVDYVLPLTAMQFAQGFGRLIRTEADRGAALVLDRRLQSPGPTRRFILGTLPDTNIVEAFDRDDAWTKAIEFVEGAKPDLSSAIATTNDLLGQTIESLQLLPNEDPTAKLQQAAAAVFGIDALHASQISVMKSILSGKDCIAVLPTGFGKSICFQLPALLHWESRPVVVVSPLVALIKDQVDDLRGQRGLRQVQGITGTTPAALQTDILQRVADGRIRLLYVSPERLVRNPVLQQALARLEINALIVDEAHCVSVWGHDFRPEFRQIPKAVASFKRSPRAGLTATATPRVQNDIGTSLDLDNPEIVREPADRPNLRYRVVRCDNDRDRAGHVLRIATSMKGIPGIIYASRRATTEELAGLLRRCGFSARHYHAGMMPEQREAVQEDFQADTVTIIVATKAFGMGINKANVGWVVHYDLPDSLDGYAQEAGRAARQRDMVGECVLLYTKRDIATRLGQLQSAGAADEPDTARHVLDWIAKCSATRGQFAVFDGTEAAESLSLDEDDLNVIVSRLEDVGAVRRELDVSARGTVSVGTQEPVDPDDRQRFRQLLRVTLRTTPHTRSLIDFEALKGKGFDPGQVEADLIRWSLDGLVVFSSTSRLWQVEVVNPRLDRSRYSKLVSDWATWNKRRLDAIIDFAKATECRRKLIAEHFGDHPAPCQSDHQQLCDVCSAESPVWSELSAAAVPDPENSVDVEFEVLSAIAWTGRFTKGRYGEVSLLAALAGKESVGDGKPISAGLLSCPQFGALKYLTSGDKRAKEAVSSLVARGLVTRDEAQRSGTHYQSLNVTPIGERYVRSGRG
jgi:ATP-dependent DNA helicase RecQ